MHTLSAPRSRLLAALLIGLPVLCAAGGRELPRLPADRELAGAADSPGAVTFSHAQHLDASRPDCTACHPRLFRIVRTGQAAAPIRHADMDAGRACGACHNGRTAFGRDDCTACHRGE
jgi:c(7)-type cytochrome triheme protein